jgi:toxin ParE1/3/4
VSIRAPQARSSTRALQGELLLAEFRLSELAAADIDDILDHGASLFGEAAAATYVRGLNKVFNLLCDYPLAGPADEETGLELRRGHYRNHRIFYRADEQLILVVRIVHYARDLDGLDWGLSRGDE